MWRDRTTAVESILTIDYWRKLISEQIATKSQRIRRKFINLKTKAGLPSDTLKQKRLPRKGTEILESIARGKIKCEWAIEIRPFQWETNVNRTTWQKSQRVESKEQFDGSRTECFKWARQGINWGTDWETKQDYARFANESTSCQI